MEIVPNASVPGSPGGWSNTVYHHWQIQSWYYLTMSVRVLLAINVFDQRAVEPLCLTKGELNCATFCLPKYVWRPVVTEKSYIWRYILICSGGKFIEPPILCSIGSFEVEHDVRALFPFHSIAFFKDLPLNTTRTIHKPEGIEFCCNETNCLQLSIRATQFFVKLNSRKTKLFVCHCHLTFTIDLVVGEATHILIDQRSLVISQRLTLRDILCVKEAHPYICMSFRGRSYPDAIDFQLMEKQSSLVKLTRVHIR